MDQLTQDVRQAVRFLRRRPLFTGVAALTLALGIGASTALFSIVRGVLLEPLPYDAPDRLTTVSTRFERQGVERAPLAGPELVDLNERSRQFEGVAGIWPRFGTLGGTDDPEQIHVGLITGNFFDVLGAEPRRGRAIRPADDVPGAPDVLMLSHEVWERRYGGDPEVIGATVEYNSEPFTVLGVMPPGFEVLMPPEAGMPEISAWLPWRGRYAEMPRSWHIFRGIGRLREGAAPDAASVELAAIAGQLAASVLDYAESGLAFGVEPLHEDLVAHVEPALLALFGAVGLLLLIASLNVAGLLLAQAVAREQELAVRAAVGASRGRTIRQLLIENLALFAAGGAAGSLVAWGLLAVLPALAPPDLPRLDAIALDLRAFGFGLAATLTAGLVCGLLPAWHAARHDLAPALKGTRTTAGRGRQRLRAALVAGEVALAVTLLCGAGLMLRSFGALTAVEQGFVAEDVLTFKVSLPSSRYSYGEPQKISGFYQRLVDGIGALPAVEDAGTVDGLPLDGAASAGEAYAYDTPDGVIEWGARSAEYRAVTADYFRAMGIRLLAGRFFDAHDDLEHPPVVIVDDKLARTAFPAGDAVGERLKVDRFVGGESIVEWAMVVGVVEHVRNVDLSFEGLEQIYQPHFQSPRRSMKVALRAPSAASPEARATLLAQVRGVLKTVDPARAIFEVRPMTDYVDRALARTRLVALLLSGFAAMAALLSALGIYGVLAYAVRMARREIGIRMALGAGTWQIFRQFVGGALRLAVLGVAAGLGLAWTLAPWLASVVFGVGVRDAATFAAVSCVALATALLAAGLPARQAAAVEPTSALRG